MLSPRRYFCSDDTRKEHKQPESIRSILERRYIKIKKGTTLSQDDPLIHEHLSISEESMKRITELPYQLKELEETFYDTERFELLKENCWLRFRDNKWSLKYQVEKHNGILQYLELFTLNEIINKLCDILKSKVLYSDPKDYCPYPFASFSTIRYIFDQDWWIDVTMLEKEYFYVTATIDRPVFSQLDEISIYHLDLFKDFQGFDCSVPSKVIAYLFYRKKSEILDILRDITEAPDICFYPSNPFMSTTKSENEVMKQAAIEITTELTKIGFNPVNDTSTEEIIMKWSCYCLSCTVSNQGIVVRYFPERTTPKSFPVDKSGVTRAIRQIHEYIQKEIAYDQEYYGDEFINNNTTGC